MSLTLILQGLIAIPKLIDQMKELNNWFQTAQANGWFEKSAEAHQKLDKPGSTSEEKKQAAKEIGDLWKKL